MKIFWSADWNDGTQERDGDVGFVEAELEYPVTLDGLSDEEQVEADVLLERAAARLRRALLTLVQDLPVGLFSNEDWKITISPHGYIVGDDEDYDEEAAVRG